MTASGTSVQELAAAAGLACEYEDARGERQTIAPAALEAILARLGLPADSAAARRASFERLRAERESHGLPPLVTADLGRPVALPGRHGRERVEIALEGGGGVLEGTLARRGGVAYAPGVDEPGYHRLRLGAYETTLAVAPAACHWPERDGVPATGLWGVSAQIHALRRSSGGGRRGEAAAGDPAIGDGGIGDFTSVAELAEAAAGHGADALAVSPVHAMFAADPGHASPYSPSNRLLLNGLLADPAARFGAAAVGAAAAALGQAEGRLAWEEAELIDWPVVGRAKLRLLRHLYDQLPDHPGLAEALAAFRAARGRTLEDHAVFEALHDALRDSRGRPQHWRAWGADYADPGAPGVARFRESHAAEVGFHAFLQWLAEDGLERAQARARAAGMAIGLIADLAVGADGGGSQAWASREDMLTGLSMGAPPDIYNPKGQAWGLEAFNPHALRRSGFRPFLAMLRAGLAWAGGLRIDHILGLHRVWVVPEGAPPTEGAYLQFPLDDLLRLVTLESVRARAAIIGEDLGTVPGGLRRKLAARRILGMSVLWFEQEAGRFLPPHRWRVESAAMTTTHDLPTVAGWWSGRDLDWRDRLDLYPGPEAAAAARADRARERRALWTAFRRAGVASGNPPPLTPSAAPTEAALAFVGASACRLALAPLEDLVGETEQPNLPGTVEEHPNWRRRLPAAARRLDAPNVVERVTTLARARRKVAAPAPEGSRIGGTPG